MKNFNIKNKRDSCGMNRRGFLLAEETLKIVIAVICIGFLIYFLTALYFKNKGNEDLEFAEATLERLVAEINAGATSFEVYNPENSFGTHWVFFIWPYGGDEIRPKRCSGRGWEKCICICGLDSLTIKKSGFSEECDELGTCLEFKSDLEIDNPSWYPNEDDAIEFKELPIILQINKESKKITKK